MSNRELHGIYSEASKSFALHPHKPPPVRPSATINEASQISSERLERQTGTLDVYLRRIHLAFRQEANMREKDRHLMNRYSGKPLFWKTAGRTKLSVQGDAWMRPSMFSMTLADDIIATTPFAIRTPATGALPRETKILRTIQTLKGATFNHTAVPNILLASSALPSTCMRNARSVTDAPLPSPQRNAERSTNPYNEGDSEPSWTPKERAGLIGGGAENEGKVLATPHMTSWSIMISMCFDVAMSSTASALPPPPPYRLCTSSLFWCVNHPSSSCSKTTAQTTPPH